MNVYVAIGLVAYFLGACAYLFAMLFVAHPDIDKPYDWGWFGLSFAISLIWPVAVIAILFGKADPEFTPEANDDDHSL